MLFWEYIKILANISGAISAVIFIIAGVNWFYRFAGDLLSFLILAIFFLLGCIFLYKSVKKNIKDVKIEVDSKIINKSLARLQGYEFSRDNIPRIIPSKFLVQKMGNYLIEEGNSWSNDAQLTSLNFYIDFEEFKSKKIIMQAYFVSKWKSTVMTAYSGNLSSKSFEDLQSYYPRQAVPQIPFYEAFPLWREALQSCLTSLAENLPKNFKIAIHSGDTLSIYFEYSANLVKTRKLFTMSRNNDLIRHDNGESLRLLLS